MLNLRLQHKLLQKLSPQQIQLMKLLQVPTIAIEQRVKQEIEENPALEEGLDDEIEDREEDIQGEEEVEQTKEEEEFDIEDYISDDDTPDYKLSANNTSPDNEARSIPFASGKSFQELLLSQLGLRKLDKHKYNLGVFIIGSLDDTGYLQREIKGMVNDLAFSQGVSTSEEEILEVLEIIQEFDPAGVGAQSLKDCLLIQLFKKQSDEDAVLNAIFIIKNSFNEFSKKHYDKILKKLDISKDELKEAIDEILKLNPKPGNSMSDSARHNQIITPDFFVTVQDGRIEFSLNARNAPELRVSNTYREMLNAYAESKKKGDKRQKETVLFVKQKLDSAKWFIDAIKQRQNTLNVTMEALLAFQESFFLTGDETKLKPMILKDIAEIVGLDISTISRVVSSKYAQTPYGTRLLKSYFSESLQTDSGEEVSTHEVKNILRECVDNEDKNKPISDEKLAGILKEKGYNIARRTVAKYREQLSIPVARMRKEL